MEIHNMRLILTAVISSLIPLGLSAQEAQDESTDSDEEIVELSPFEVSEGLTRYDAGESLAGTRIAISNIELPASITAISEKLVEDTVAINVGDTFNMVAGVLAGGAGGGAQTGNSFVIRGYTIGSSERDGLPDTLFSGTGGFDYSLVDRIEIVKGPSGILYGAHSPGGVVNLVSKKPLLKPRTRFSAMIGSYNMYRAEIDHSNFLDKNRKWGYRISASYYDYDGTVDAPQDDLKEGRLAVNPTLMYRGDGGFQAWIWTAFVRDEANRLGTMTRGFATEDGRGAFVTDKAFVSGGAGNNLHNNLSKVDVDNYELGFSKSFGGDRITSDLRVVVRFTDRLSDGSRVRGIGNGNSPGFEEFLDENGVPYPTRNGRNDGVDSRQILFSSLNNGKVGFVSRYGIRWDLRPATTDTQNYSVDYNLNFDTRGIRHSLLLFGVYEDTVAERLDFLVDVQPDLATLEAITDQPGGRIVNYPFGIKPDASFWTPEWVEANETSRRDRGTRFTDGTELGVGVIERAYFLKDRLIVVAGARYTDFESAVTQSVHDVVTESPPEGDEVWTTNVAVLGKIADTEETTLSLFANFNETFIPVFTLDERLATLNQKFPNRFAKTTEFGLKANVLQGKASVSLVYFDNTESDVLVNFEDDLQGTLTGIPEETYRVPSGSRDTSGWELELIANPWPGLDLMASWSDVEGTIADGSRPQNIPEHTASFFGRYELQEGLLEGLSLAWQANWWGEATMGSRTRWITPGGGMHNAIIGYGAGNWRLNLRIGNVFDSVEIYPSTFETAVIVNPLRDYRLSFTYDF